MKTMAKKSKIYILYNHVSGAEKETEDTKLALKFVKHSVKSLHHDNFEFIYFHEHTLLGSRKFSFFREFSEANVILVVVTPDFERNEYVKFKNDAAVIERLKKKNVIPLIVGENTDVPDVFCLDERHLFFDEIGYMLEEEQWKWELVKRSIMSIVEGISTDNGACNVINGDTSSVRDRFAGGMGLLADKGLTYLASRLGAEWPQVAINLGLSNEEIEHIQLDNPNQTVKQITKALVKWRGKQINKSKDAILNILIETLKECDRADLVKELQEKYRITDKKCYRPDNLLKALEPVITADKRKPHDVEACLKNNCNYHQLEFDGITPANGNCLFEAVSVQLDRTPKDLRQSVVNYLRHNRAYQGLDEHVQFENFVEGNFDDYLDNMSRDGEWGDHVIVVGLSQMLHRNIAIITSSPETAQEDSMTLVMGDNSYKSKPLLLGHYWENHYQSLKPIENEYTDVSDDGPSTDMDNRKETKNELFKQKDTSMKEQSKSLGITPEEGTSNDRTRNKNTSHKKAHPQETVPVNIVFSSVDGSHTKTENVTNTSEQQKTKHVMEKGEGKPLGGVRIKEKTDMTDNEKARERRNINFSENQSNSVMKETKKTLNQEQKNEDISQMAPITKNILDRDCRKETEKAGDEETILYANEMQEEEICNNLKSENQSNSVKKDSKERLNQEQKNGNMMQVEQETNTPDENRQNEMENADAQETIQQDEMYNGPNNEIDLILVMIYEVSY